MSSGNYNFKNLKVISGHQPVYLPWLGLFHKLYLSDKFVYMDTVQYLDGDWNNRNKIKTSQNELMLTVPISKKKSKNKKLNEIIIHGYEQKNKKDFWQRVHWESIKLNYKKSPFFDYYAKDLEDMYTKKNWKYLIDICWYQFNLFRKYLNLENKEVIRMSEFDFTGTKDELIIDHCTKLGGTGVVFGKHGRDYVDINKFNEKKILVYYQNYQHPVYNQMFNNFIPNLCVLDLLLNAGPEKSKKIFLEDNISKYSLEKPTHWVNYNNIYAN